MKYNWSDRTAQEIKKLNVPSIENLANRERVPVVKSCLYKESNEEFNNYFKLFEHKYKTRIKLNQNLPSKVFTFPEKFYTID